MHAPKKPFTWSYSRLKNFESCRKKHYHVDLLREATDQSDAMDWGNEVHKAFDLRIKAAGKPFHWPMGMVHYEPWVAKLEGLGGRIYGEQGLAITREFAPTGYFDRDVWLRVKVDALVVKDVVAGAYDWKTGKIVEDSVQLGLAAAVVFAHQPQIQAVQSEFVWLKEKETTPEVFYANAMSGFWAALLPRVAAMEEAYKTTTYPADPSGLCRNYCPVRSCPHHGK